MNASTRPQRRRKSSLASEHPAYPVPTGEQPTQAEQEPPEQDPAPSPAPDEGGSRAGARTRARETAEPSGERPRAGHGEEARARKVARDAAWGWASAMRKADRRVGEWATEMERARSLGTLPGVLRGYIQEAANRVGIDPSEVPDEVWRAAGLERN